MPASFFDFYLQDNQVQYNKILEINETMLSKIQNKILEIPSSFELEGSEDQNSSPIIPSFINLLGLKKKYRR